MRLRLSDLMAVWAHTEQYMHELSWLLQCAGEVCKYVQLQSVKSCRNHLLSAQAGVAQEEDWLYIPARLTLPLETSTSCFALGKRLGGIQLLSASCHPRRSEEGQMMSRGQSSEKQAAINVACNQHMRTLHQCFVVIWRTAGRCAFQSQYRQALKLP